MKATEHYHASTGGNGTFGGSVISCQCYYRGIDSVKERVNICLKIFIMSEVDIDHPFNYGQFKKNTCILRKNDRNLSLNYTYFHSRELVNILLEKGCGIRIEE